MTHAMAVVDGTIWWAGQWDNVIGRINPRTETFQSWTIPSGGVYAGIIRHRRPTRDGNLLIHQSRTNRITLGTMKGPAKTQ